MLLWIQHTDLPGVGHLRYNCIRRPSQRGAPADVWFDLHWGGDYPVGYPIDRGHYAAAEKEINTPYPVGMIVAGKSGFVPNPANITGLRCSKGSAYPGAVEHLKKKDK
jgi:hypothetical protein